jgi:hypothetical protein
MSEEVPRIADSVIRVTPLPTFSCNTQFSSRAEGKPAFYQLDGPFERSALTHGQENMGVIWHKNEFMHQEFTLVSCREERGEKQRSCALGLE